MAYFLSHICSNSYSFYGQNTVPKNTVKTIGIITLFKINVGHFNYTLIFLVCYKSKALDFIMYVS